MSAARILQKGERITQAHYEQVTVAALGDLIAPEGMTRTSGGKVLHGQEETGLCLYRLKEDPKKNSLNDHDEPYFSAKARRMSINPLSQEVVEGPDTAEYRITFPGKACPRYRNGEIITAAYSPRWSTIIATDGRKYADVWIKNNGSTTAPAGTIVGIGAPVNTTTSAPGFGCDLTFLAVNPPTAAHRMGNWAILMDDCPAGKTVGGYNTGMAVLRVNVRHASNTFVDIEPNENGHFRTGEWGWGKILWKESGTGLKWARVDFNRHETEFIGKSVGTLVHGTTGTVEQYYDPATAVGINEDVLHDWMTGGVDIPDDKEVQVRWFSNKGVLRIVNAEC